MQALLLSILATIAHAQALSVQPNQDYVCPDFPLCYQGYTGAWKNMELNTSAVSTLPRDASVVESSECWLDGYFCRYDGSNMIRSMKLNTAEECQDKCLEDNSCGFFSFHEARGQGYCSLLLKACLVNRKCSQAEKCATGPRSCNCPKLEYLPGKKESVRYARWNCGQIDPYASKIPVGTTCTATCAAWKDSSIKSTCLKNGKWSTTAPSSRRSLGYAVSYPTPEQPDMECGCPEVGPYNYDPNTENGAQFVCDGRDSEDYKKDGGWTIKPSDKCQLFCSNALKPVVSVYCDGATWTGEPELGFWCYDKPENPRPQEQAPAATKGDPQCSRPYKTLSDKWRMVEYGVPHPTVHCDKIGFTTGWHAFRFDRRYATLPSSPPAEENRQNDRKTCGTYFSSWSPSALPTMGQAPQDIKIHFAYGSYEIRPGWSVTGKVVACPGEDGQNIFLYYLPQVYGCNAAYCAV